MLTEDVFLHIGSFALYTLGVALAVGFLTGTVVAIPETRRRGIRRRAILDLMLLLMLTTVGGARLMSVIMHWDDHARNPLRVFSIPSDGLSYYGGLVVGLIVIGVFAFRRDIQLWTMLDALAPPAALGMTAGLAILLSTNMLRWRTGGIPWISLLIFTVAYGGTVTLWRWRGKVRFEGELALLLLGGDSLIRILVGSVWALGNGPYASVRSSFVMLSIAATLWFVRRGASVRNEAGATDERPETVHPGRRRTTWFVGYAVLMGLILVRYRMGLA